MRAQGNQTKGHTKEEIMNISEPSAEVKARIAARAAATDVEVVVKVSKSDFNKGLKLVKGMGGKFNGQTKEWTITLDSISSTLQHPEWNGIELVSVNGFAVAAAESPAVAGVARIARTGAMKDIRNMTTAQLYRDMDRADSDF